MGTPVRLRVVFAGSHILSKSQKLEGLKRSWLLVKPQYHETIADVMFYILNVFHLLDSCPNGLILSMDGFVLPPFESTHILKDKDLIRVKRKDNAALALEEDVTVEKQRLTTDMQLLTNEDCEEVAGGYESDSEPNEDAEHAEISGLDLSSRKRKAPIKLQASKCKRQRKVSPRDAEISTPKKDGEKLRHEATLKKDKASAKMREQNHVDTQEVDGCNTVIKSTPNVDKHTEPCNGSGIDVSMSGLDHERKKPSRSTLRKKAQRRHKKIEFIKRQSPVKDMNADSSSKKANLEMGEGDSAKISEPQQEGEDDGSEGEIVPIVIRPGHIRFGSKGKDVEQNQDMQQNKDAMESFQWNINISKRKGQKWGMEKPSTQKKNEYRAPNRDYSRSQAPRRAKSMNDAVNFKKLVPLTDLPKQDDILAYRLLELGSSWCPEISAFRVGKVSWFQPESNKLLLMPVPEYPLNIEKKKEDDASVQQCDEFQYNEDGSLEIEFTNLVDVRIVNRSTFGSEGANGMVNQTVEPPLKAIEAFTDSKGMVFDAQPIHKATEMGTSSGGNQKIDVWEEMTEALSAKKAQLKEDDNWNKKVCSGSGTWSRRTLKSNGVGQTVDWMKAQNGV